MKAIGFGTPKNLKGADGVSRPLISLKALPEGNSGPKRLPQEIVDNLQLKRSEVDAEIIALDGAPSVAAVVRTMVDNHGPKLTRVGIETALTFVSNVLTKPGDLRMYRVKKANPLFQRTLGCLEGSDMLMRAIGFICGTDSKLGGGADGLANSTTQSGVPSVVAYVLKPLGEDGFDPSNAVAAEAGAGNLPGILRDLIAFDDLIIEINEQEVRSRLNFHS
jgi:hypothetical protein